MPTYPVICNVNITFMVKSLFERTMSLYLSEIVFLGMRQICFERPVNLIMDSSTVVQVPGSTRRY